MPNATPHTPEQLAALTFQAERLASLATVISSVSHELNNPLTAVQGYAEMLVGECHDQPEVLEMAQAICDQVERCVSLVKHLWRFAHDQRTNLSAVELDAIVVDVLSLLAHQLQRCDVEISMDDELKPPSVLADHAMVQTIALQLITHSLRALKESAPPRRLSIAPVTEGESIALTIHHNGTPPSPSDLESLFDPFHPAGVLGGEGCIGLAQAYALARSQGGSLEAQAPAQGGFTYTLRLPFAPPAQA